MVEVALPSVKVGGEEAFHEIRMPYGCGARPADAVHELGGGHTWWNSVAAIHSLFGCTVAVCSMILHLPLLRICNYQIAFKGNILHISLLLSLY
jgi:hypothetical protein